MRSAILFAALILKDGLGGETYTKDVYELILVMLLVFFAMDFFEWGNKLIKKNK